MEARALVKRIFSSALQWPFDSLASEYRILYTIIRHHKVFKYINKNALKRMHTRNPLTSKGYTKSKIHTVGSRLSLIGLMKNKV